MANVFSIDPANGCMVDTTNHGGYFVRSQPGTDGAGCFAFSKNASPAFDAYLGYARAANHWMRGSADGDLVIGTTNNKRILLGCNGGGGSASLIITSTGVELNGAGTTITGMAARQARTAAPAGADLESLVIDVNTGLIYVQ